MKTLLAVLSVLAITLAFAEAPKTVAPVVIAPVPKVETAKDLKSHVNVCKKIIGQRYGDHLCKAQPKVNCVCAE